MSISPPAGQLGPLLQNAGHVPQPVGMWTESMMTRPPVYDWCVVMRTLWRVFWTCGVVSTRIMACPALFIDVRFADCWSTLSYWRYRERQSTYRSGLVNVGDDAVREGNRLELRELLVGCCFDLSTVLCCERWYCERTVVALSLTACITDRKSTSILSNSGETSPLTCCGGRGLVFVLVLVFLCH